MDSFAWGNLPPWQGLLKTSFWITLVPKRQSVQNIFFPPFLGNTSGHVFPPFSIFFFFSPQKKTSPNIATGVSPPDQCAPLTFQKPFFRSVFFPPQSIFFFPPPAFTKNFTFLFPSRNSSVKLTLFFHLVYFSFRFGSQKSPEDENRPPLPKLQWLQKVNPETPPHTPPHFRKIRPPCNGPRFFFPPFGPGFVGGVFQRFLSCPFSGNLTKNPLYNPPFFFGYSPQGKVSSGVPLPSFFLIWKGEDFL